jgi:spore maturation protein CgeB
LLNEVADYLEENAVTVVDGFKAVLGLRGLNEPEILKNYYKYFTMMYKYIKTYRRVKCLEKIAASGLIVDVCDSSWENVNFSKNLRIHGTTFNESLKLYKRSKVLLNEMAEFNSGSHNRIFDGTLSGAAIVSEYSSYLAEKFENGIDIEYFNWNNLNKMPQIIQSLLKDENKRDAMVHNAYNKVLNEHMPVHRASIILEIVNSYLSGRYKNLYKQVTK